MVQNVRDGFQGGIQSILQNVPDTAKKLARAYESVIGPAMQQMQNGQASLPLGGAAALMAGLASGSHNLDDARAATGLLMSAMKVFGLDQQGFGLMALNAIIFIAELVSDDNAIFKLL